MEGIELPDGFDPDESAISLSMTPGGNIRADDKKTAAWVLENMFDGVIRLPDIENSEFSNQTLYRYWDSVANAEQDIFDVTDWVCSNCDRRFDDRATFVSHTNGCGGPTERSHERAREILGRESVSSNYVVYQLLIEHECDNEWYYYVGMTQNMHARLSHHIQKGRSGLSIPHSSDSPHKCTNYTVYDADIVAEVDSEGEARTIEMTYPYELCLDKKTTKILGGR